MNICVGNLTLQNPNDFGNFDIQLIFKYKFSNDFKASERGIFVCCQIGGSQ